MKKAKLERILALSLTLVMMLSIMLVFTVAGSAEGADNTYVLDVDDLIPFPNGAKYNGQYEKAGTNDYFTIFYSVKAKVEANSKNFSDGLPSSQRISWGDKTTVNSEEILNAIKITTSGSATVKIWWGCGDDGRNPAIFDANGSLVAKDENTSIKNDLYISTLNIPSQGIYYIGNVNGSNYFHQIAVTDSNDGTSPAPRVDWATVSAPVISSATDDSSGNIIVSVNATVGHDGADELLLSMYDSNGDLVITKGSITEKKIHSFVFTPADSGKYSFKAELVRANEESKLSESVDADFVYVLQAPNISSAYSIGNSKIQIKWNSVHEAEAYNIYQDGVKIDTLDAGYLSYIVSDLTIDQKYSFVVSAVRGTEELKSSAASAIATLNEQREWGFTVYGPSASESKNSYTGSINDNGYVTVSSQGGGGKIQPTKVDGLAFYYTAIPTEYNFTLRARVTVDEWTLSNGQEGFGLLVTDRLGEHGNTSDFWNNSYLAGSTKIEYKYDGDNDQIIDIKVVNPSFSKFSMKLGIGVVSRTGVTKDNLHLLEGKGDVDAGEMTSTEAQNEYFKARNYTLDRTAADITSTGGTYNVIGNYTSLPAGSFEERFLITEYIIEIQKNNSGYFITHYDLDGNKVMEKKFYDPEALNHLDEDYVYAGFFASRNVTATFSDVELTTILASEDDTPIEIPPITYITPTVAVNSGSVTTSSNYEFIADVNVGGNLTIEYDGDVIADSVYLDPEERFRTNIELNDYGVNSIKIYFTPDPDQVLGDYIELSDTKTLYLNHDVTYNKGNYHRKTIYISPDVVPHTTTANGTKENPFDIFTALENAYPGQTLILMEGTYKPGSALKVQRGMDGTADAMIRLIADPEAKTRPVIDFEELYAGFTHAGDYWYFRGFDITGSLDMQKGFQISGNYNVLDQINTYENGNTGIQLSRLSGSDLMEDWPSYNLILNCTSYRNYDSGFEDADGFAAKLTCGPGNVFDGCIAYNNADDGWDLYAKVETGPIGAVTIRNCIAYENGFVPGAGSKTGNGNGFKMGGESLSGKHVLENSIAFNNLMKGIDSNSCPDIIVNNCISFNNGSHNVAFYTNSAENTAFVANGVVSFRTTNTDVAEQLKGKGNQVVADYRNDTTFYWNESTEECMNSLGERITADMFVSLVFGGPERNEDGSINLNGFLELKDTAPAKALGCKLGGKASEAIVLLEDEECTFKKGWINLDKNAHWHVCECGNKTDVEAHDLVWYIDKPVQGNIPGVKHQECTICGYKKAAVSIYPQPPTGDDNKPTTPSTPNLPNDPEQPTDEPTEELSFFQRIWQAILNFFKRIFGIEDKAFYYAHNRHFL